MRRLSIILILLIAHALATEPPRDISARDLISFSSIRAVDLHEPSKTIIYELRETDFSNNTYRHHLWQMKTDGSNNRQLTFSSGNEWSPLISPTGACLAFLSDRPDAEGEKETRIWGMPLSGGEAKPLSNSDHTVLTYDWSADGNSIYYLTPQVKPTATKKWLENIEADGFDGDDRTLEKPRIELWRIDKNTAELKRLFVGDPGVYDFDVHPDNDLMVYVTNYTGDENDWVESDLYLFSISDSAQTKQLTAYKGAEDNPRFSPDGKYVAYSTPQDPKKPFSQTEIDIISIENGNVNRLTGSLDLNVSKFSWYTDRSLLLEVNQGMNNHVHIAALNGRTTDVSAGPAYFHRVVSGPKAQSIVAVRETATSLGEIIYSKGAGHPWLVLSNQSAEIHDLNIHPQTNFYWKSRDDRFKLEGLVILPHFSGHEPLPLIVHVHGGPASRTDIALEQYHLLQAWASQGFAVFSPNFRGSEGYSATFQTANYRDLGGGDYHDIMMGVKELIRRGIAHPDSLVIMGGSYGGYMTNWASTQTNKFKAAISLYGIYDLKSDFSNSIYAQWELDYLGKPYWEDPSAYSRRSPSSFIKQSKTPTLILHGADDENTFTSNSRELARALKTLEVPHRFILYPREGHGMNEPNHRLDAFQKELSWANLHLDRPQPHQGIDWMSSNIRVQILSVNREAEFLNAPGERFLSVKLLLDGSNLESPRRITLDDFEMMPSGNVVLGFSSKRMLAPAKYFSLEIGPRLPAVELDLVFVYTPHASQVLKIKDVGTFSLPKASK
ncbi:MAG: S9 family peptidase [Candidatus Marinimicrobia bacterium]|nr:S9 family peptidase [Candidatus Neomarinimicrobiota bacterium]MCF7850891.1 S9 family peptidase [Candidatus Neomarinimicrobiota bacterium]